MTERLTAEKFLRNLNSRYVYVYLLSGIKLQGHLIDHHSDQIFLRPRGSRDAEIQMIARHAISTIVLAPPGDLRNLSLEEVRGVLRRPRRAERDSTSTSQ